ncbi:hypothetical protein [Microvirga lotononidis]|nr:hypothetical protein [Microvirga lotononidis]WQO28393.1 hypothetical protein U0023_04670 [Microvirga lotononidis]
MSGKSEGRDRGLAERSVNTSVAPPTEGNSGHRIRNEGSSADRRLEENDQRKGLDRTERPITMAEGNPEP